MEKTCKTCEYYYKEHCCNGISEYCTEMVLDEYTCEDWEAKEHEHNRN